MPKIEQGNLINASVFAMSADKMGIFGKTLAVQKVRFDYATDADGKLTDRVVAVKYDTVDPDNFSEQTIKVEGSKPVITQKEIDATDDATYINVPLDKTIVKPYSIEFGKAKLSVKAEFVELSKL